MLDFHGLISLRPQHRAELLFAELCTITAIIVILNFCQPFFLRTIDNTFTVIIHQVYPLLTPKRGEGANPHPYSKRKPEAWRGQGLVHSSNFRQGNELWRAPPSVWGQNAGGQRLDCSPAFFLICIFSLFPIWTCLDLGIPPSLLHAPSSPEQIASSSAKALTALMPLSGSKLYRVEDTT